MSLGTLLLLSYLVGYSNYCCVSMICSYVGEPNQGSFLARLLILIKTGGLLQNFEDRRRLR